MKFPTEDTLILSVKLASGDFETELRIPMSIVKNHPETVVIQWLDLMKTAFHNDILELRATLKETK